MDPVRESPRSSRTGSVLLGLVACAAALVLMQDVFGIPFGSEHPLKVLAATSANPDIVRLSLSSIVPTDPQLRRQMRIWEGRRRLQGPYRSMAELRKAGPGSFFIGAVVSVLPCSGGESQEGAEYRAWVPRPVPSWVRWPVYFSAVVWILIPGTRRQFQRHPVGKGKLLHLEGLRGLACLIVVMNHFINLFYPNLSVEDLASKKWFDPEMLYHWVPLASLVNCGAFAVDLFFVLSGFVLYLPFCGAVADRGRRLTLAVIRRPVRLYGILAAVMVITYLLRVGGWPFGRFYNPPKLLPEFLLDLGTAYGSAIDYNRVFWTIHYELIGSLGIYAFAFVLGWTRWRWAGYVAAFVGLRHTFYADFVMGMILADLFKSHPGDGKGRTGSAVPFMLLFLGLLAGTCSLTPDKLSAGSRWLRQTLPDPGVLLVGSYGSIGAVLVITAVLLSPALQRILGFRSLAWLGRLSYSTYGIHVPILGSCVSWWMFRLHPSVENAGIVFEPDGPGYHVAAAASLLFYLVLVVVFSAALSAFVDEPCVRLSRGILQRRAKQSAGAAAPGDPRMDGVSRIAPE